MKEFVHTYAFAVAVLAVVVLRLVLGVSMPVSIDATASYYDAWCLNAADSIAAGEWLGEYGATTLVKSPGFPLFLAFCNAAGVDYLLADTMLYILASLFFMWAVRPLFRRRWLFFASLALVMFCPVGFAADTFQRIYVNSVSAAQALFVFGGFLGVYLRCKGQRSIDPLRVNEYGLWRRVTKTWQLALPWALVGSLALGWFAITREDAFWALPVVIVIAALTVVTLAMRRIRREIGTVSLVVCTVLALLPFGAAAADVAVVEHLNEEHYGVSVVSETGTGNFARLVQDLYAIDVDDEPDDPRVTCTSEALEKAFIASPTLEGIRPQIEYAVEGYGDEYDGVPGDGEVESGMLLWTLRRAANRAGWYSDAEQADRLYGQAADELEEAFEEGLLEEKADAGSTRFSVVPPWRDGALGLVAPSFATALWQAVSYGDVTCMPDVSHGKAGRIEAFEELAGNPGLGEDDAVPFACELGEGVVSLYRVAGPALAALGLAGFVVLAVAWARSLARRDEPGRLGSCVLVLLVLLLGSCTLLAGLAYVYATMFEPTTYYFDGAAAYPLLLAFSCLSASGALEWLRGRSGDGEGRPAEAVEDGESGGEGDGR